MYYFDLNNSNNRTLTEYSLLNTVSALEKQYSKKQVTKAKLTRNIQIRIGRPSERRFLKILDNNELMKCPVTVEDGRRAIKLHGPDVASTKGVTVKGKGQIKSVFVPIDLPKSLYPKHKNVTLCLDFFFANGIPFFHSISCGINFRTVR